MRNNTKVTIIFSMLLLSVGMVFFSLAIQKYRVITGSRAAGRSDVDIIFGSQSFGKLNQKFGILLPSIADDAAVTEIKNAYGSTGMYIKLINPDADTIDHPNFTILQNAGFKWYLSFSTHVAMSEVMNHFTTKYDVEAVAELSDHTKLDAAQVDALLLAHPKIKFHAYSAVFLPREKIRDIVHRVAPPKLEAVGISSEESENGVFDDIYLIFATFFDAAKDIQGGSPTKIDYPAGSALSLSNINIPQSDVKAQARRTGHIASAIVAAIESQGKSTNAPFKYVIAGDVTKMSTQDKIIIGKYNDFMRAELDIVWPYAISANGDPWYNPFLSQSNTDPIMGVIGRKGTSLFGIMFNSRTQNAKAHLPNGNDYTSLKGYSNIRGPGNFISNGVIEFSAHEVIIFFAPDLSTEVGSTSPTATVAPTSAATPTGTPPATTPTPTSTPPQGATNTPQPTNSPAPSNTPVPHTNTPVPPTATPTPEPTAIPTPVATWTPAPTWTPQPTYTLAPTHTPSPTATYTPSPTVTPRPPTPTRVPNLAVDGQKPGIAPWLFILSPLAIVLIGLLL